MNVGNYIGDNYTMLCNFARRYTAHPIDLVHHVYIKCHDKEAKDPFMYLKTSFWREANCNGGSSNFKSQYTYNSLEVEDRQDPKKLDETLIQKDRIDFHLLAFDQFEREVFRIYSDGYNMAKFSRESNIEESVVKNTLKKIKDHLKKTL